jgi:hypothetical protein
LAEISARRIVSLDEATNEARVCAVHYEQTRDEVLRAHPWNFATERATLSELSSAPAFGWAHQFQLPSNFLRLLQLNDAEDDEGVRACEIEGGKLLTDEDSAQIRYTARITDESKYDNLFIEAFAAKLASKIARPITGGSNDGMALLQRYESVILPRAKRIDANENKPRQRVNYLESNLVRARSSSDIG